MPAGKRKASNLDWDAPNIGSSSMTEKAIDPVYLDSSAKPPPQKKQRKKKNPDVTEPEKRGAIFKKSCPKNILDRVDRVMSQRFFMVEREREGTDLHEEFSVLGSTGNVYTVVIDKKPSCNCPDALKGNHCKHILFIYLKVLQVSQASGYWYQKALLTSELAEIFAHAPLAPNSVAHARVREAYNKAMGKETSMVDKSDNSKKRIPGLEDECPICYETMYKVDIKKLSFCDECGNGLHNECFQQWAKTAKKLTCVWCRANWVSPSTAGASGSGASRSAEGYLNLSSVPGVEAGRDTSSYYHGPKKGKRYYGYQEYRY